MDLRALREEMKVVARGERSAPVKVFILEDDLTRISLFHEVLGFNTDVFHTVEDAKAGYKPPYDLILLDHDLEDHHYHQAPDGETFGSLEGTGTEFARWLATQEDKSIPVIIHSYNRDGAMRMLRDLHEAGWQVVYHPFGTSLLRALENWKELNATEPSTTSGTKV